MQSAYSEVSDEKQVSTSFGTLASETELRHFLKLARPEWSKPRRRGRSDVVRVQEKLKAVGVTDIDTLIKRVDKNTINEELYQRGFVPLSRESMDSIRRQKTFVQALDGVDVPNIRQVGVFDPVAQMLSRRQLGPQSRKGSKKEEARSRRRHAIVSDFEEVQASPPWPRLRGVVTKKPKAKGHEAASAGQLVQLPAMTAPTGFSRTYSNPLPDARLPSNGATASASSSASRLERMDTSERLEGSKAASKRASLGGREGASTSPPSMEEMLALQRAGQRMLESLDTQNAAAKWSPKSRKTPLEQGEEMLQEQEALDLRERLVRVVKSKSQPPDPFRSHIAGNIKQRLEDAAYNDSKEALAINQRCLNIRKHLAGMVNARKELASLRGKVHLLMEEPILPRLIVESQGLFTEQLYGLDQWP